VSVGNRAEPLVAVVCRVPLLSEAVKEALEGIATVRPFPAGREDTGGLLQALEPDGVVVDSDEEAHQAAVFARATQSPLVHVSLHDRGLRVFQDGRWHEADEDASPESVRNALVGGLFRRERAT
jgi:hypothetical protein